MRTIFTISVGMMFMCAAARAQDIETKLSGNSATQGFTVKSNTGNPLFTVRGGGHAGIGTEAPTANLHVSGIDGFLVTGTYNSGSIPATGSGTRMMFYPKNLRSGRGMYMGRNGMTRISDLVPPRWETRLPPAVTFPPRWDTTRSPMVTARPQLADTTSEVEAQPVGWLQIHCSRSASAQVHPRARMR